MPPVRRNERKRMDYEQAEALMTDKRFQKLKYKQEKVNVFTIVGHIRSIGTAPL